MNGVGERNCSLWSFQCIKLVIFQRRVDSKNTPIEASLRRSGRAASALTILQLGFRVLEPFCSGTGSIPRIWRGGSEFRAHAVLSLFVLVHRLASTHPRFIQKLLYFPHSAPRLSLLAARHDALLAPAGLYTVFRHALRMPVYARNVLSRHNFQKFGCFFFGFYKWGCEIRR